MLSPSTDSTAAASQWSKTAIASALLGIVGFVTLWLVGGLFVAGIAAVCGHVARYETSVEPLRGRGLATFGLSLGYGAMLLFPVLALIVAVSLPAISSWRSGLDASQRAASQEKASALYTACEVYARANGNRYPTDWNQLSGSYMPARQLSKVLRSPYSEGENIAFELVPHDRPVLDATADSVIVIQERAPADVREIAVVYANGEVRMLYNPDYESP
ncbi:MAG: DUF4190 domain-containing protein [Verrucomicrobiales bacterium]